MSTDSPLRLVLDTNVVLDWLLFNDNKLHTLRSAHKAQRLSVLTHDFAVAEWRKVLAYPQFKLDAQRQHALLERYLHHTQRANLDAGFDTHNLLLPEAFPRCRDGDDQPFLALCYHSKADALVTKDKALLKLRKHAKKFGVTLVDGHAVDAWLSRKL